MGWPERVAPEMTRTEPPAGSSSDWTFTLAAGISGASAVLTVLTLLAAHAASAQASSDAICVLFTWILRLSVVLARKRSRRKCHGCPELRMCSRECTAQPGALMSDAGERQVIVFSQVPASPSEFVRIICPGTGWTNIFYDT